MDSKIREEFWHAFEKSPVIMIRLDGSSDHAAPMTAQLDKDAHHAIWFYTSRGNRIAAGGRAVAEFSSKGHDVFASLSGTLTEETDPATIDRHWSKPVEAWFPKGRNDPDLVMLRLDIGHSEVWTVDAGIIGTFKLLTGQDVRSSDLGKHAIGVV